MTTMTNEFIPLLLPFIAGVLLGILFFGGLWLTISRGVSSKHPVIWFTVSLFMRTGIVVTGFYLIATDDWYRILACLAGFIAARLLLTRAMVKVSKEPASIIKEGSHEH